MSGITRTLDRALRREPPGRVGEFGQVGQGVFEKFRNRGLHCIGACRLGCFREPAILPGYSCSRPSGGH